jgi:hypothetical protein
MRRELRVAGNGSGAALRGGFWGAMVGTQPADSGFPSTSLRAGSPGSLRSRVGMTRSSRACVDRPSVVVHLGRTASRPASGGKPCFYGVAASLHGSRSLRKCGGTADIPHLFFMFPRECMTDSSPGSADSGGAGCFPEARKSLVWRGQGRRAAEKVDDGWRQGFAIVLHSAQLQDS